MLQMKQHVEPASKPQDREAGWELCLSLLLSYMYSQTNLSTVTVKQGQQQTKQCRTQATMAEIHSEKGFHTDQLIQ